MDDKVPSSLREERLSVFVFLITGKSLSSSALLFGISDLFLVFFLVDTFFFNLKKHFWLHVFACCMIPSWKRKLSCVRHFIKLLPSNEFQYGNTNRERFWCWNDGKQKKYGGSVLTGIKHTKIVQPGDRFLNREIPDKSGRLSRYVFPGKIWSLMNKFKEIYP